MINEPLIKFADISRSVCRIFFFFAKLIEQN